MVNAKKVKLTGRKDDQERFIASTRYSEGGLREERAAVRQASGASLVEEVRGMLPKTKMGEAMYRS